MDAWEPNDEVMAAEAAQLKREQAGFKTAQDKLAILKMIDPATDGKKVCGVPATVEEMRPAGTRWVSGRQTGWKLVLGSGYGRDANTKWLVVGEGLTLGLSAKQLALALKKLAEVKAVEGEKNADERKQQAARARYALYIANPAGHALIARLNSGCVSEYGYTEFAVSVDGRLTYKYDTFTGDQWNAILDLRDAQKAQMAALKAGFVAANKAA